MQENQSQKRFKTAGARILRPRKLPKDFFSSYDRKLTSSGSLHHQNPKSPQPQPYLEPHHKYPNIFEFTFMAKKSTSLRKTKSNLVDSFSSKHTYFPSLKRNDIQKENKSVCLPVIKDSVNMYFKQPEEETPPKRKLQKKSLAQFNKG